MQAVQTKKKLILCLLSTFHYGPRICFRWECNSTRLVTHTYVYGSTIPSENNITKYSNPPTLLWRLVWLLQFPQNFLSMGYGWSPQPKFLLNVWSSSLHWNLVHVFSNICVVVSCVGRLCSAVMYVSMHWSRSFISFCRIYVWREVRKVLSPEFPSFLVQKACRKKFNFCSNDKEGINTHLPELSDLMPFFFFF